MDRDDVISNLEQQIRWIEEIECHKFPGWLNVTNAIRDALAMLKKQEEIIQCKDCYYYHKPEYGFTIGDCTYRTAWYPVKENEFCSLAKRKEGR